MSIKNLTLSQAREKMGVKQDELGKVFTEAKADDGQYDFNKVTCLGDQVKGSIAVAEKVKAMNGELDELGVHIETLTAAEKAAGAHADREKGIRNFPLPGSGGQGGGAAQHQFKSIGELVALSAEYKSWAGKGAPQGLEFSFADLYPSDFLASAGAVQTLGQKALFATTSGYAPEVLRMPGFVEKATRPLQLIDIIPMSRTGESAIKYMEETTRDHLAAEIAEGGTYPEDAYLFTEKSSPVQKIGTSIPVTDEQLEDVAFMESYLNGRLTFGVRQRADRQSYIGDGLGSNLLGIRNTPGIQTQAKGADPTMDAFYKAMTKIRKIGRAIPTHHVMDPEDWQDIRLTRTADGVYIFGAPTEAGPERLWGLPVVQNDADGAGTGLVGAFDPAWISLSERRGVEVQVGYVGTQFTEGKRTIRADMRAALTKFRPSAFCEVTGI
ncbi:phage major capsid protein [Allopontixanthobacter sp.]|uniref:phage major capsid protein n=1 Tax=Allopontixanthobacter sp. TaxID=2906452 RepID=UPI002AB8E3D7|nr:phage major capsid protein [Allopontixanthobacter sp.]MDZ4307553.1 phage major capsid protein [Allopontixanthobacter sp.]